MSVCEHCWCLKCAVISSLFVPFHSATLTPSASSHGTSIEIFATIRLIKATTKHIDPSALTSNKTINFDSTVVSGSHKAETLRNTGTNSITNSSSTIYRSSASHSTKTLNTITSISNSLDYVWREQAIFRHALPEGLLSPYLPRPQDLVLQPPGTNNAGGNRYVMFCSLLCC